MKAPKLGSSESDAKQSLSVPANWGKSTEHTESRILHGPHASDYVIRDELDSISN